MPLTFEQQQRSAEGAGVRQWLCRRGDGQCCESEIACKRLSCALCPQWNEMQIHWGLVNSQLFL